MYDTFSLKHDMGKRAAEFSVLNPSDAPRYQELLDGLNAAVESGRRYTELFGEGIDARHSNVRQRKENREEILDEIRDIVRIGKALTRDVPSLTGYFRVGPVSQKEEELLARGRQYAAKVAEHQAFFTGYAFDEAALATLNGRLDALEDAILRGIDARALHVGARNETRAIAKRILEYVDALDAIHRRRFAGNLEKLGAWISASKIAWPAPKTARARRNKVQPAAPDQPRGGTAIVPLN